MTKLLHDWPPPYTIKKNVRAKRISMRITPQNGLEIVIPKKETQQRAIEFLNSKYNWVQKYRHLLQETRQEISVPEVIQLLTINETWAVKRADLPIDRPLLLCNEQQKTIFIHSRNSDSALLLIKDWLKEKAGIHLPELLKLYSQKYHLPFTDVKVRFQRSRWGSCSANKAINLNCKLLLLPANLTHYIMVHELIHTIHFDHSPRFWEAVEKIIPDQRQLRNQLKNFEHELGNWL